MVCERRSHLYSRGYSFVYVLIRMLFIIYKDFVIFFCLNRLHVSYYQMGCVLKGLDGVGSLNTCIIKVSFYHDFFWWIVVRFNYKIFRKTGGYVFLIFKAKTSGNYFRWWLKINSAVSYATTWIGRSWGILTALVSRKLLLKIIFIRERGGSTGSGVEKREL